MIKVVICGDHPVVREGMKVAFSQTPDIRAVAEASTGAELLENAGSTCLSAVILDISLPGSNGLHVLKDLASRRITVPVLISSMHPEGPVRAAGAARWPPGESTSARPRASCWPKSSGAGARLQPLHRRQPPHHPPPQAAPPRRPGPLRGGKPAAGVEPFYLLWLGVSLTLRAPAFSARSIWRRTRCSLADSGSTVS